MNGRSLHTDWSSAESRPIDRPAISRLNEIKAPTLVIVGDEDLPHCLANADLITSKVSGSRKVIIEDAAHLPSLERPEEFNRVLLDFLTAQMHATLNGARINYERGGAGFPVILLHAGIADSRMWEPQAGAFAKHFDVLRPDQRGYGKSELPPVAWSPVDDLLALIDELGLKPAHLVGCSMGGSSAIDFALDHPDRISKLVLVGSSIGGFAFRPEHAHLFAEAATAQKAGDLGALNTAMLHLLLDGPERRRGYVKEPLRKLFLDMNSIAIHSDFEKAPPAQNVLAMRRLHEITAPTLVVVGDKDVPTVLEAADLLNDSIPNARKAVIHNAAHLPNLEHPEEFNRIVLDFLLAD